MTLFLKTPAKIRLSENNTKRITFFFVVEREYVGRQTYKKTRPIHFILLFFLNFADT